MNENQKSVGTRRGSARRVTGYLDIPGVGLVGCIALGGIGTCVAQAIADAPALEEITVTAQKRSENLQSVPIAITAITAGAAQAAGVTGTDSLQILTPSLNINAPAGNMTPYIRGVGTQAAGAGNDSSVATYVDGVYMPSMAGTLFEFNNIDRVEVLKGPQGTLFGRNATGGVINVVTRDPSQKSEATASIGYGNFNTVETSFYGTTGITNNLAADVAMLYRDQGTGWGRNIADGQQVAKEGDLLLRTKWRFDATPTTTIWATADFERTHPADAGINRSFSESVPISGVVHTGSFWDINSESYLAPVIKQGGGSLRVEQSIGEYRFVSITADRRLSSAVYFDLDGSPIPIVTVGLSEQDSTFTQEFQLTSPSTDRLRWIVGAFLLTGYSESDPFSTSGFAFGPSPTAFVHLFAKQETQSVAAFAQGTYDLAQDTRLTVGARYTVDRHHFSFEKFTDAGPAPPETNLPDPTNRAGEPTWRIALDHNFTDTILGYVSYNRGFRSGVYNLTDETNPPLKPETLDAYEGGFKSDLLDKRLRVNVASYFYNFKNIQLVRTTEAVQEILNASGARIYGADGDATAIVTKNLSLRAGFGYTHGRYTSFEGAPCTSPNPTGGNLLFACDASGHVTVRTPTWTADFGPEYRLPSSVGNFIASATYYFNNGWYTDPDNRLRAPAYFLLDGTVGWQSLDERYDVKLWGKNLTNKLYYSYLTEQVTGDVGPPAAPRTYGIRVSVKF